jgi:hypothetical protein
VQFALAENSSAEDVADELFDALSYIEGVNTATVYLAENRIDVGYCESVVTQAGVMQALSGTGLVAP